MDSGADVALYDGRVHDLGTPPPNRWSTYWSDAEAYDINDSNAMVVSSNALAGADIASAYGAYVGIWAGKGPVEWHELGGTTTSRPGAQAYSIAPNGDVAGDIFAIDEFGDAIKDRPTLWLRRPGTYTYRAVHPAMTIEDLTSRKKQDVLVGMMSNAPVFWPYHKSALTLTLAGTGDLYASPQAVEHGSGKTFYVVGVGFKTKKELGNFQGGVQLRWTVSCSASFSCHQVGDPIVVPLLKKCRWALLLSVDSAGLVAGECDSGHGDLPFVWNGGATINLNRAVPSGSPKLDTLAGLSDNGRITGSTVSGRGNPPQYLATPLP